MAREVVLSRNLGETWGLGIFSNLEIKSVAQGSPAERTGLSKGERIVAVDDVDVQSLAPVLKILKVNCRLRRIAVDLLLLRSFLLALLSGLSITETAISVRNRRCETLSATTQTQSDSTAP